jgi:chromosome segregation ATPase
MDIYLFGFIIITIGCLVVTIITMYSHSHKLQSTIVELEDEIEDLEGELFITDSPSELKIRLSISQTARRLQQEQIKELKEELIEVEKELLLLPR